MAQAICRKRLQMELVSLQKSPVEHITALPHDKNILEWHYVLEGPPGTPYEGGHYHGIVRFPKEYPYKPPSIIMYTKNGRFKTNMRLCLSMSDYHVEQWNPMWSVSSILQGLLSFMVENTATLGSMETSEARRRALAAKSLEENVKNKDFCALFPQYVELYKERLEAKRNKKLEQEAAAENLDTNLIESAREGESLNEANAAAVQHNAAEFSDVSCRIVILALGVVAVIISYLYGSQNSN